MKWKAVKVRKKISKSKETHFDFYLEDIYASPLVENNGGVSKFDKKKMVG